MIVNAQQAGLIARGRRLMARMWALHYDRAADFVRDYAAGWKDRQLGGTASACWALSQELRTVRGSWDVYVEARDLAAAMAAEVLSTRVSKIDTGSDFVVAVYNHGGTL